MRLVIEIGFPKIQNPMDLTQEHFNKIQKRADLVRLAQENEIPIEKALNKVKYEIELGKLQSEFVNLQKWIAQKKCVLQSFLKREMPLEKAVLSNDLKST